MNGRQTAALRTDAPERRVGLVGCVKDKATVACRAKDLYVSPLFRGRRAYVERTCHEWWILSAEHGVIHPNATLAPYDVTLKGASAQRRRAWSDQVLTDMDSKLDLSPGDVVEIHAGADYRNFGLIDGLRARGLSVEVPVAGLSMGEQLRFYLRSGHGLQ